MTTVPGRDPAGLHRILSKKGPLRAFHYRDFSFYWLGSTIAVTSFFMLLIARGWLVLEITNSPFMIGAVSAVSLAPALFLSMVGGVIADRVSRKMVLILGETVNMMMLFLLSVLILTGIVEVWHIFLLSLINGISFALAVPSRLAIVPSLIPIEDLANGVALSSTMFSGAQLVGPALAGFLLAKLGTGITFLVASLVLGPAILAFTQMRLHHQEPHSGTQFGSILGGIIEGFSYVGRNAILIGLLAMGLVTTIFYMPYQNLLPVFARDVLEAGETGLGLLAASAGLGAVAGSLAVAAMSTPRQVRLLLLLGAIGFGTFVVLFSLSPIFLLSVGLSLFLGFFFQLFMTSNMTLVQISSPDYVRGRVLSIRFIIIGLMPVGFLGLGAAAEKWGAPLATAGMGAMGLGLMLIIILLFPVLRRDVEASFVEQVVESETLAPARIEDPV